METQLATKISQIIQRDDGSEVRIVAQVCFGLGLSQSIMVHVHVRKSMQHTWELCSTTPHSNWQRMSVDEYIAHGRSKMLQTVSPSEILKLTSAIGKPISSISNQ